MSNAVYYYGQKGKWRCFSDTVVKNNVSQTDSYYTDSNPNMLEMCIQALSYNYLLV